MRHVAQFRSVSAPPSGTSYASPVWVYAWSATEAIGTVPWCVDGTFSRLFIQLASAPGSGNSLTFTLMKNGVATALAVTISGTDLEGSNTSDTVAVVDGDTLSLRCSETGGTPTQSIVAGAIVFDSTNPGESGYATQLPGLVANSGAFSSFPFATAADWLSPVARNLIHPVEGEYTKIIISLEVAPGVGASRTYQVYRNSTPIAGTTCTISGTDTSVVVPIPVVVEPGQVLSIGATGFSGSPAATRASLGARFRAYRDGESFVALAVSTDGLAAPATEYLHGFGYGSFDASEPAAPTKVWEDWSLLRLAATGANNQLAAATWTIRRNGVDTTGVLFTYGTDIAHICPVWATPVSPTSGDALTIRAVSTSLSGRTAVLSGAQFIAPTPSVPTALGLGFWHDGLPLATLTTGLATFDAWQDGTVLVVADEVAATVLNVSVHDTVAADDVLVVPPLDLAVNDAVTVVEDLAVSLATAVLVLTVAVFDDVAISETFDEQPDANVRDTVSVTDAVTTLLTLALLQQAKHETVTVAEAVTARLSRLVDASEPVTVAEAVTTVAWDTERVEADDAVTVVEDASAVLNDAATASPNETVAVTEDVASALQATLSADVSEAATIAEGVTPSLSPLRVQVFEAVEVREVNSLPIGAPQLFERVIVTDAVTVVAPVLVVTVAEALSVSEGGLNPNVAPDGAISYGPLPTTLPGNALEDYWEVGL